MSVAFFRGEEERQCHGVRIDSIAHVECGISDIAFDRAEQVIADVQAQCAQGRHTYFCSGIESEPRCVCIGSDNGQRQRRRL